MTQLQGPEDSQENRLTKMIHRYEKDILRLCYPEKKMSVFDLASASDCSAQFCKGSK